MSRAERCTLGRVQPGARGGPAATRWLVGESRAPEGFRRCGLAVPLVWSDGHVGHAPVLQTVDGQVYDHPETPARPGLIREALEAAGLVRSVAPTAHDDALLDAVHEPKYREFIRDTCAELDPNVSVTPARGVAGSGGAATVRPGGAGGVLLVWAGRAADAGDVWGRRARRWTWR